MNPNADPMNGRLLARHRPGFTLIEVVVALAISGMIVMLARSTLDAVADASTRLGADVGLRARTWNAEELIRTLVYQAAATPGDARTAFAGDEAQVRFASWCAVPGGWEEPCIVTLRLVSTDASQRLVAEGATPQPFVVRAGVHTGAFRYLRTAADGGEWIRSWQSVSTLPLAIGVLLDGDTLVWRVGAGR